MLGDFAGFFQTAELGMEWRSWRVCRLGRTAILHGDHGDSGRLAGCYHCFRHRVRGPQMYSVKVVSGKWRKYSRGISPYAQGRIHQIGRNELTLGFAWGHCRFTPLPPSQNAWVFSAHTKRAAVFGFRRNSATHALLRSCFYSPSSFPANAEISL